MVFEEENFFLSLARTLSARPPKGNFQLLEPRNRFGTP